VKSNTNFSMNKSRYKMIKLSLCLNKHYAMKTYRRSGGIAPRIDFRTTWRWVVSFTIRPLYPQGKSPRYSLYMRLCGTHSQSRHDGEEKNSQPLAKIEP